jgi:serine hydrolase
MAKKVLFICGAGEGAYHADKKLADSLQQALGSHYAVRYPVMPDADNAEQWKQRIESRAGYPGGPLGRCLHSGQVPR